MRYGTGMPPAVDGIDLAAEPGEVLVVLGPNGAGKTSTIETLEGYRPPGRRARCASSGSTRSATTPP